jgi:porphobilinogen synthase
LVAENNLLPEDLVLPLFITEGTSAPEPIRSMPGQYRLNVQDALKIATRAHAKGLRAVAFFPRVRDSEKDPRAKESANANGLIPQALRLFRERLPDLTLITDVAMDPYSSDGHDGLVHNHKILNDETLIILAEQALTQAKAGADFVAPSDMMDGRVRYIRQHLDVHGFQDVGIIAYSAKYASSFYGPFREALDSAPKHGDKKTYQMDPANSREALREIALDIAEGADMILIKPALSYLDIIAKAHATSPVPICAYNVSGEYAMVKAVGQLGWGDADLMAREILLSIKRAGADLIFTYHALDILGISIADALKDKP